MCAEPRPDDLPPDTGDSLSYRAGVRQRFGPSLAVGVVAAVVAGLFSAGWTAVALVAAGAFLAALLLPARSRPLRRLPPGGSRAR